MGFSQETIDYILKEASIEEEIAQYVKLEPRGKNLVGSCPFHKEKTPSFSVSPQKRIFKCFGCGIGGNVIKFLMKKERLTFPEVMKYLIIKYRINYDKFGYSGDGNVYVLLLDKDNYYIGYTENLEKRLEEHFNEGGSKWTKQYKPLKVVEVYENVNTEVENTVTEIYMRKYGWKNVRGGDLSYRNISFQELPKYVHKRTYEGVYVLLLENDKYYVGFGNNMASDITKHYKGKGNEWTKLHKPVKIVETFKTRNYDHYKSITLKYMSEYGWKNVRGYKWQDINIEEPKEL